MSFSRLWYKPGPVGGTFHPSEERNVFHNGVWDKLWRFKKYRPLLREHKDKITHYINDRLEGHVFVVAESGKPLTVDDVYTSVIKIMEKYKEASK